MLKNVPISLSGPIMNIKLDLKLSFRYSKQHWVATIESEAWAGNIFYTTNYRRIMIFSYIHKFA